MQLAGAHADAAWGLYALLMLGLVAILITALVWAIKNGNFKGLLEPLPLVVMAVGFGLGWTVAFALGASAGVAALIGLGVLIFIALWTAYA